MWQWSPMVTPPSPERRPSVALVAPRSLRCHPWSEPIVAGFKHVQRSTAGFLWKLKLGKTLLSTPGESSMYIYYHIFTSRSFSDGPLSLRIHGVSPLEGPITSDHKKPTRRPGLRDVLFWQGQICRLSHQGGGLLKKTPMYGMWPLNGRYNMVLPHQNWGYNLGITWYNWYNMV